MKFVNSDIVFQEIPGEVTLAVNISNCPCRCPGCHSKYLWGDIGEGLTEGVIDSFVLDYQREITCISFMGGDSEPGEVNRLAGYIKGRYPWLKTAWYTGRTVIDRVIERCNFDYIKVGPYIEHLGPLNVRTTNQRMYKVEDSNLIDITSGFWRK